MNENRTLFAALACVLPTPVLFLAAAAAGNANPVILYLLCILFAYAINIWGMIRYYRQEDCILWAPMAGHVVSFLAVRLSASGSSFAIGMAYIIGIVYCLPLFLVAAILTLKTWAAGKRRSQSGKDE